MKKCLIKSRDNCQCAHNPNCRSVHCWSCRDEDDEVVAADDDEWMMTIDEDLRSQSVIENGYEFFLGLLHRLPIRNDCPAIVVDGDDDVGDDFVATLHELFGKNPWLQNFCCSYRDDVFQLVAVVVAPPPLHLLSSDHHNRLDLNANRRWRFRSTIDIFPD